MTLSTRFTLLPTAVAVLAAVTTLMGFVPEVWAQAARTARRTPRTAAATAPEQLLRQVRANYQNLNAFSMNIEHRDSSGLYPGAFRQTLQWRKRNHFTLRTTSRNDKEVPDFYADGTRVVFAFPDGRQFIEKVAVTPNTMPGWEVSGGMIVSFLQGTPNSHFFLRPPQGAMLTYAFGPRTRWHGHKVREILVTIARGEEKPGAPISFFVDPANKTLTGFEWTGNGKVGYAVYTGQKKNPNLPLALGQAPKPKPGGVVVDATKHTGAPPAPPSLLAAGTAAPDFTVEDATGKPLKLSDFRGKVVVLDFWATWCGPCIASLPHTNTVARKFKDKDVVVVALNVMDEKKAFAAWLPKNRQYDALVFAIDPRGRGNNVAHTLYQVSGIPTQYVIDKDGRIVKGFVGYGGPTDDLENAIAAAQAKDKAK